MSALPIQDPDQNVNNVVAKVNELAVLPHVVYKVLEISGSIDSPAAEMEKAIVVDPGFSTKLLRHANSAFYGLPKKVTSIKEAILFLGFKQVRQMAMTVGFFDMFVGKNDKESLRRRKWWRHSIDSAVCCRWLGNHTKRMAPEDAYTCGLLHYMGKTLLDRYESGMYDRVELLISQGVNDVKAEQMVFGCDHVAVAMAAAEKWGLPEALIESLNYLEAHNPNSSHATGCACVALGGAIAHRAVDGPDCEQLPSWALATLGISEEDAQSVMEQGIEAIRAAANLHF